MDHWAPRPMRQLNIDGMFGTSAHTTTITNTSPMERQRIKDGSPITRGNVTRFHPPETPLIIKGKCSSEELKKTDDECSDIEKVNKAQEFIKSYMGR